MSTVQREQSTTSFPYQLRLARTRRGWSQARLASELDTDSKTVSRWECGQVTPAAYFRERLCALFAMNIQELGLLENAEVLPSPSLLFDPAIPLAPSFRLVGREAQLTSFSQRLKSGHDSALSGLPGVGKTALSVALAHAPELLAHFRDGVLWAGLGPDPNILGHILRWGAMLDIPVTETSDSDAGFIALHRVMNSRRMLLILDDVWRPEDALALKVGGSNCAHLVTTRFAWVATQFAVGGATVLEELTGEEGETLLRTLAPQVVEREPQRVHELVEVVGGLPLALILMGNWLRIQSYRSHPRRVDQAIQLLRNDAATRLTLQESRSPAERHASQPGAACISLRSIISVSVDQLGSEARTALFALAIFPPKPNSFSEEAALAVAGCRVESLDVLVDAGLLQLNSESRYMLHPTIADYACVHLEQSGRFAETSQRFVAYVTSFVEAHCIDSPILERERTNILAALEAAFSQDGITELPRLAVAFTPFLLARGLSSTAETHLQRGHQAATFLDDGAGQAQVLAALAQVRQQQNRQVNEK